MRPKPLVRVALLLALLLSPAVQAATEPFEPGTVSGWIADHLQLFNTQWPWIASVVAPNQAPQVAGSGGTELDPEGVPNGEGGPGWDPDGVMAIPPADGSDSGDSSTGS